jgi:hypothetical protein
MWPNIQPSDTPERHLPGQEGLSGGEPLLDFNLCDPEDGICALPDERNI